MKKIIYWLFILILLAFPIKNSQALLMKAIEEAYNVIPISPVINFGEDIAETGKMAIATRNRVKSLLIQIKTDLSNLRYSFSNIFSIINNIIPYKNTESTMETNMCGSKPEKMDVNKMAIKMKEILLTYKKASQKDEVERNRRNFYLDNIYNIYASVKLMQADISEKGAVSTAIATTKECCIEGNGTPCGIASTSATLESEDGGGNNATLHAYGYALATMEDLVKMWERVAALKAQYQSLKAMMSVDVLPSAKDEAEDIEDTNNELSMIQNNKLLNSINFAHISSKETMAAAQIMYKEASLSNIDFDDVKKDDISKVSAATKTEESSEGKQFGLKFNSLKVSDDYSAIIENSAKLDSYNELEEVENALEEAITAHNFIKQIEGYRESGNQYNTIKDQYAKKLQILKESNQCGRNYISKYFSTIDKTWSGKKLTTSDDIIKFIDADEKEGISGWALDAYDVAKAAETVVTEEEDGTISYEVSAVQTEDLATETLTEEDLEDMEDKIDLEKAEKKISKKKDLYDEGGGISATASENTQEENRRATLVAWNIGALASKDLSSNADNWGTSTNKKMIWNDTKAFYGQYLKRKYDNIKSYLKRFTSSDIIDVFASKLTNNASEIISRLTGTSGNVVSNTTTNNDELKIGETDYQNELKELYTNYDNLLNVITGQNNNPSGVTLADQSIQNQRSKLVEQIDEISKTIKEISDEIAIKKEAAEETSFDNMDKEINKGVDYSDNGQTSMPKLSSPEDINKDITNLANKEKEELQIKNLEQNLEKLKNDREDLQKELKNIDIILEESKIENQVTPENNSSSKTAQIEAQLAGFINSIVSLRNEHENHVETRLNAAIAIVAASDPALAITVKTAITTGATELLNTLNGDIDAIVNSAYQEIVRMGDNVYLPTSSSRIREIHEQMINELKALTISKSIIGGVISINNMIVFANLATIDTTPETRGFFVGALPRDRDLKAPYPIKDLSQPPVREIFHFDAIDFANVKPFSEKKYKKYNSITTTSGEQKRMRGISREDFLQYGGAIPEIWKLMLQENAFIESRLNLQEVLNQGCEIAAFLRGGIMPCRVENTNTVLDVNVTKEYNNETESYEYSYSNKKNQYIKREDISASNLPKCLLIGMNENNKPHHLFHDEKVDIAETVDEDESDEYASPQCKYSELGMILDADEYNNLSFKEVIYKVFNDMLDIQEETEDGDDVNKRKKNRLAIATQAELSRNQIGDFIRQAEEEKKIRQNLEEMKQNNENQIAELKELLENFGYSVGNNYDITRETDYNLTIDKLKLAKNKGIARASSLLSSIKIDADNELAKTRKKAIEKMIKILQKDKDGDVELSMSTMDDEDELDQALKSAKANKSAIEKYRKKVKEEKEKNGEYKDLEEAYCANY